MVQIISAPMPPSGFALIVTLPETVASAVLRCFRRVLWRGGIRWRGDSDAQQKQ